MAELIRLPGLVNTHAHLREYKEGVPSPQEDFGSGTRAAAAGGFTAILEMPNNPIPTVSEMELQEKMRLAQGRVYVDKRREFESF